MRDPEYKPAVNSSFHSRQTSSVQSRKSCSSLSGDHIEIPRYIWCLPIPLPGFVRRQGILVPEFYGTFNDHECEFHSHASSAGCSHLVILESEQLLPQSIVVFTLPLLCQKVLNCSSALEELVPVSPDRVRGIGLSDTSGILAVWKNVHAEKSWQRTGQ